MQRDLGALTEKPFDLIVVGGGVYGAAVAWDASLRGLSVALVEKDDFGGATSFNNLKTIHGGLRYIQHADFRRMRESIRERRTLMKIAPHLVHPLAFLVPTYRELKQSRSAMVVALFLNDLVSFDRNRLDDPEKNLPAGRLISRSECLELAPGARQEGLTGGAIWYDAQMHNSDRMTLSFVISAAKKGAQVANHLEMTDFLRKENRVTGIRAKDGLSGEAIEIQGRVVVNAAGPWVDRVLARLGDGERPPLFHFSMAMNLVTRPIVGKAAVGMSCKRIHRDVDALVGKGTRFVFIVPWHRFSMIGTSHTTYQGEPDAVEAGEKDIQELLDDVNAAYPGAELRREDVRLVHRGILPMVPGSGSSSGVTLVKQYTIRDHRREGIEGLLTLVGVKYTTARDVAEKTVDRVLDQLGKESPSSKSGETPLYGGDIERFDDYLNDELKRKPAEMSDASIRHLVHTYGTAYRDILSYVGDSPELAQPVCEDSPVLRAEIVHAVREEQALDLASAVLRRTELGSAGHPGRSGLEEVAELMSSELGWDDVRAGREIERVEEIYRRRS
jgi:glycerol-3-phosphate dehydrogenase